ncbi:MAG: hypothetical protein ACRDZY_11630, partial [Acidimicrobiales bacterium]
MAGGDKVRVEPLDTENYATWSERMKWLLMHKGYWGAISTSEEVSETLSNKALALIGLNVKDHHLSSLGKCSTAKEAWDMFQNTYKAKSTARRLQLRRQLNSIRKEAREPIDVYVARAKAIWTDLQATGYDMKLQEVTWSILAGLPKEYDTVVTFLESSDKALELEEIVPKLIRVEQRANEDNKEADVSAYITRAAPRGPTAYHNANNHSRQSSGNPHSNKVCHYCHKKGHIIADCRSRMNHQRQNRQTAYSGKQVALATMAGDARQEWIVDSGSTYHVTCSKDKLTDFRSLDTTVSITFGNGQVEQAEGVGHVTFSTSVKGRRNEITLKDVLYVPGATV